MTCTLLGSYTQQVLWLTVYNGFVDVFNMIISINQSKRKTSSANGQTNLGHKFKAPEHKSRLWL